jgi:hypothetical protein
LGILSDKMSGFNGLHVVTELRGINPRFRAGRNRYARGGAGVRPWRCMISPIFALLADRRQPPRGPRQLLGNRADRLQQV